jgi:hypothetical protein
MPDATYTAATTPTATGEITSRPLNNGPKKRHLNPDAAVAPPILDSTHNAFNSNR